jgi:hypothetical protein
VADDLQLRCTSILKDIVARYALCLPGADAPECGSAWPGIRHAFLFVGSRLLSSFTVPGVSTLHNRDMFIVMWTLKTWLLPPREDSAVGQACGSSSVPDESLQSPKMEPKLGIKRSERSLRERIQRELDGADKMSGITSKYQRSNTSARFSRWFCSNTDDTLASRYK